MLIIKDKIDKLNKRNDLVYTPKKGDRVYVSDYTDLYKREVDKYFKQFEDVKRVSKLEDCNVIIDEHSYEFPLLSYGNLYNYLIDGNWVTSTSHYDNTTVYQFYKSCEKVLSKQMLSNHFNVYGSNYTWLNDNLCKRRPDLCYITYDLYHIKDTHKNIIDDIDNFRIFSDKEFKKQVSDYINDNNKEDFEGIDFNSVKSLFKSNSSDDVKLAITLLKNYDMRDYFTELLIVFFETHGNSDIRKFLQKYPVFKDMGLPNKGTHYVDFGYRSSGYKQFIKCAKHLKQEGYEINYKAINDFLLNGL